MGQLFAGALAAGGEGQTLENPRPHFGGGLVGEGQGDDLFRVLHRGQQGEETLGQQLGLAGAGGGVDDDGLPRQGGAAGLGVGGEEGVEVVGHGADISIVTTGRLFDRKNS